jgi:hypothetical protein
VACIWKTEHLCQKERIAMVRRIRGGLTSVFLWLGLLAGCTPASVSESPGDLARDQPAMPANGLAASLQTESFADSVRFHLRLTNASDAAVELTFPTGQSFDFVVSQGGREVWRWSADQMFTQAIRHERLAPGETREYTARWTPPAAVRGEFEVRGWLTAQEHRLEQRTALRLP